MSIVAIVLVVLVALLHLYFLVLEMFLWTRPIGLKVFRQTAEKAAQSRVLAANQGLYNGFLAAGLLYALARGSREYMLFFLACVVVAGAYGAWSVNRRIFFVQALPAILAVVAVVAEAAGVSGWD
jgi:putative membrane protein